MWYCLLCYRRWFSLLSLFIKPECVTIQTKAIEQYFHVALFLRLHTVTLGIKSECEAVQCDEVSDIYYII